MGTDFGARYLQIGQVAERTELSLKTIRHYDEVGLVQPSARSAKPGSGSIPRRMWTGYWSSAV